MFWGVAAAVLLFVGYLAWEQKRKQVQPCGGIFSFENKGLVLYGEKTLFIPIAQIDHVKLCYNPQEWGRPTHTITLEVIQKDGTRAQAVYQSQPVMDPASPEQVGQIFSQMFPGWPQQGAAPDKKVKTWQAEQPVSPFEMQARLQEQGLRCVLVETPAAK